MTAAYPHPRLPTTPSVESCCSTARVLPLERHHRGSFDPHSFTRPTKAIIFARLYIGEVLLVAAIRNTTGGHSQPHLLANIGDCLSFVQDGSNESLTWNEKGCDPGQARALETWRKSTQGSRHHHWHFVDELGPTGLIIQPHLSAVDDITEFYSIRSSSNDSTRFALIENKKKWLRFRDLVGPTTPGSVTVGPSTVKVAFAKRSCAIDSRAVLRKKKQQQQQQQPNDTQKSTTLAGDGESTSPVGW